MRSVTKLFNSQFKKIAEHIFLPRGSYDKLKFLIEEKIHSFRKITPKPS